ncbi:hypothetical protein AgCh_021019 [Apium graveolens]
MNILLPLLSTILAAFILPPFVLFKLVYSLLKRTLLIEDVAGKVVVITGASSGLGEHVAYEYAKRGACLVLVARREDLLRVVADKAKQLGSPDVLVVKADVSNTADCKNFVDQTIQHFHKCQITVDHLVNNAGMAPVCMFEDYKDVCDHKSAMATKAALISFFETLRIEVGSEIGISIVTPGMIGSELTNDEFLSKTNARFVPLESVEGSAQAIVNGTRCGDSANVFLGVELLTTRMVIELNDITAMTMSKNLLRGLPRRVLITEVSVSYKTRKEDHGVNKRLGELVSAAASQAMVTM